MSGGSESDDCATANGTVYIPEVRNEDTPAVGMEFDSLDLVYNFYNRYAFLAGFGIRHHSSFWGKMKKEILRKEFVCCKQGAYRKDETRERKRQRGISRCECKAKIVVVKTNGSKKYTISLFAEGHNHTMTPSERVHFLRSHRRISDSTKVLTKQLGSVNIPIHQKVSIFEVQSGGMEKIGFMKKDIYNLECSVNGKLRNHDVELVTEYFMAEQKKMRLFISRLREMAMTGLVDVFGQMQPLDGRTGFMEMLLYSIPHSTRIDTTWHLHQCWELITMVRQLS